MHRLQSSVTRVRPPHHLFVASASPASPPISVTFISNCLWMDRSSVGIYLAMVCLMNVEWVLIDRCDVVISFLLSCIADGFISTRFCGRIFGDFWGVHSMRLCVCSACVQRVPRAGTSLARESPVTRDESACMRAHRGTREKGPHPPVAKSEHRRQVIVGGKRNLAPERYSRHFPVARVFVSTASSKLLGLW